MCEPLGDGGLRLCGDWGCGMQVAAIFGRGRRYEPLTADPRSTADTQAPVGVLTTARRISATQAAEIKRRWMAAHPTPARERLALLRSRGWRYEPLATSYANTEALTKAAKAGVPIQVAAGPMPPTLSESGDPLPQGWYRGRCGDCGGGVLVDRGGRCMGCATRWEE